MGGNDALWSRGVKHTARWGVQLGPPDDFTGQELQDNINWIFSKGGVSTQPE